MEANKILKAMQQRLQQAGGAGVLVMDAQLMEKYGES